MNQNYYYIIIKFKLDTLHGRFLDNPFKIFFF